MRRHQEIGLLSIFSLTLLAIVCWGIEGFEPGHKQTQMTMDKDYSSSASYEADKEADVFDTYLL